MIFFCLTGNDETKYASVGKYPIDPPESLSYDTQAIVSVLPL